MRYDVIEIERAARRRRAEAVAALIAAAFAWLVSRKPRVAHPAGPHFAR